MVITRQAFRLMRAWLLRGPRSLKLIPTSASPPRFGRCRAWPIMIWETEEMNIVHIACKLPKGIIIGGIPINGYQWTGMMPGQQPPHEVIRGFGITLNFPADKWAAWLKANYDSDLVTRRLIYASDSAQAVRAFAQAWSGAMTDAPLRLAGLHDGQ